MNIEEMVNKQHKFFQKGYTKSIPYRIKALKRLRNTIIEKEQIIIDALKADLNKSDFEAYMTEIGIVLDEIRYVIKHTLHWVKDENKRTPMAQFKARSFVKTEPYGVVLIMSPWNYPFQLSIAPLIGAIATGNCAILKPSAYASHTAQVLADIISESFSKEYIGVVQGGRQENQALLDQKFDYIFFTGGVKVGKLVMEKAARNLTPVTLELGGKSPCIVDKTANLRLAAKRIVFGKFLNAGQTCVAPDYLLVHKDVKDKFVDYLKGYITAFFGSNPLENDDYPKIINEKHYHRIMGLIEEENILIGGSGRNNSQIEPTIVDQITPESKVMQEEIFGPILPILTFEHCKEVKNYVNSQPKPLALYLFTRNKKMEQYILNQISFGGGCINDTIIHLATPYMGFGGVGQSGMGSYHGKYSFDTFSHKKSIIKKSNWIDLPMRYRPYTKRKEKLIRMFLK
jgi:aldehyde dehydrogenase (NAD+)